MTLETRLVPFSVTCIHANSPRKSGSLSDTERISRSPVQVTKINLPDKSDFESLHHCKLMSCLQMYLNENNFGVFKLTSPFLEAFFDQATF